MSWILKLEPSLELRGFFEAQFNPYNCNTVAASANKYVKLSNINMRIIKTSIEICEIRCVLY